MSEVDLKSLNVLKKFHFERILNEDPLAHSVTLLGSINETEDISQISDAISSKGSKMAVVRIEKSALPAALAPTLVTQCLSNTELIESTDIYHWFRGWLEPLKEYPDVKINIVYPATEVHIRKYTKQEVLMVRETPELYEQIVKPYIAAFPSSRTQWVENILSGKSEADKVLHRAPSPEFGYVILPDMKWDLTTISSLYLVAIALNKEIRSLRDLRRLHLPMLRSIRTEAIRIVKQRWGMSEGGVRLFVHYQPSYYHFHVHIVNSNYYGLMGSTVGQAHLLDDIISLLEVDMESLSGKCIFEKLTLTYGLGDQHGLFQAMKEAQEGLML